MTDSVAYGSRVVPINAIVGSSRHGGGGAALALGLTGLAAVVYGVGSILQAVGARRAVASTGGTAGAVKEWTYVSGLGCDLVGWLLSLVALRSLPLFAVQAVLAGSVAVTVVLAFVVFGVRLRSVDVGAVALVTVALALIGLSSGTQGTRPVGVGTMVGLLVAWVLVTAGGWLAARWGASVVVGGFAGLAFGGAALCARATRPHASIVGVVGNRLVWGVVLFGLVGIALHARALGSGRVGSVTAALWVTEVVVPAIAGVVLLDDRVRRGWGAVGFGGVVLAVGATVVLARSPAQAAAV